MCMQSFDTQMCFGKAVQILLGLLCRAQSDNTLFSNCSKYWLNNLFLLEIW